MLVAVLLGLSLTAVAQTSRGTVSGTVTDPTGAVIAGANVVLTNTQTGVERTTTSSDEGQYRFEAVDLGTYNVKITASGFGEVTKTNLSVTANQTAEVSAQMAPAGQTVVVDVTTEGTALLQTEAPVRGGNIETAQIQELPFAGRNPVALALTLPGVSTNRFGFGVGTFSVNGARGRSNNFLIDGTENNDISVAGQGFQITNPDAVQEVSVQTSNYDAEFGRAGGAVVNTITKSGTNEFHGTLSYLLDSTRDDAVTSAESRRAVARCPALNSGLPEPSAAPSCTTAPSSSVRFRSSGRTLPARPPSPSRRRPVALACASSSPSARARTLISTSTSSVMQSQRPAPSTSPSARSTA
jgi:hypothetical protein